MQRWIKVGAATAVGLAAGGAIAVAVGNARWKRETARAVSRLGLGARQSSATPTPTFSRELLDGLPAPVARYFAFALTPGQPLFRAATARHDGEFAMRPGQWAPFTSMQRFAVRPPAFVWNASIRLAPALPQPSVRVRDSYIGGEGAMRGAVGGLVTVVDVHGTPEMASSSLARYLGELVWVPTALLPGPHGAGVTWQPIDDSTARATLSDRGNTVTVDFHFGAGGEVTSVTGERYRDVNGTGVLTPWAGHLRDYARVQGVMIPTAGDVEWLPPDGPLPYWRAHIAEVDFDTW